MTSAELAPYLAVTEILDWQNPVVLAQAKAIAGGLSDSIAIARACFHWVRDQVDHSSDHQKNPVTCRASEVLTYRTGYCYAKSHLLAALLRANQIPAGLCYQRLSIHDDGAPYCLHGLNAVYLPEFGWYRVDPRGNRPGINAEFVPPVEHLAYPANLPGEADFAKILANPLPQVVAVLQSAKTWDQVKAALPDASLTDLRQLGDRARPSSC